MELSLSNNNVNWTNIIFEQFISNDINNINTPDDDGNTLLHDAIINNFGIDKIQILFKYGANPNIPDKNGYTPLCMAIINNRNNNVIELLIQNGAEFNAPNINKSDILYNAILHNYNINVIKLLIKNGVDTNTRNIDGFTPLNFILFKQSYIDLVEILLNNGADPNIENNEGFVPLHYAAYFSMNSAVILIKHGAKINRQSKYGTTPLHLAIEYKQKDIVEFLLSNRADPNKLNKYHETPLHYVLIYNHNYYNNVDRKYLSDLLIKYGANKNIMDIFGNFPFDQTISYDNPNFKNQYHKFTTNKNIQIKEINKMLVIINDNPIMKRVLENKMLTTKYNTKDLFELLQNIILKSTKNY